VRLLVPIYINFYREPFSKVALVRYCYACAYEVRTCKQASWQI